MGRIACIDFGLARLGLALSDERQIIASFLEVIQADKNPQKTIEKLVYALKGFQLEEIVIGMPLHLDGRDSSLCNSVKEFVLLLEKTFPCKISTWDERLSTAFAERALKEANLSRKKRSKIIDGVAAVVILQSYLEYKSIPRVNQAFL